MPHVHCVPIALAPPRRRCRAPWPPCELKQPRQAHRRQSWSRCGVDASTARVVRECRAQVEDGRASSPVPPPPPSHRPSSCAVDDRVGEARKRPVPRQSSSTFASWEHTEPCDIYDTIHVTTLLLGPPLVQEVMGVPTERQPRPLSQPSNCCPSSEYSMIGLALSL